MVVYCRPHGSVTLKPDERTTDFILLVMNNDKQKRIACFEKAQSADPEFLQVVNAEIAQNKKHGFVVEQCVATSQVNDVKFWWLQYTVKIRALCEGEYPFTKVNQDWKTDTAVLCP